MGNYIPPSPNHRLAAQVVSGSKRRGTRYKAQPQLQPRDTPSSVQCAGISYKMGTRQVSPTLGTLRYSVLGMYLVPRPSRGPESLTLRL